MSLARMDVEQELLSYLGCKYLVKLVCGYTFSLDLDLQRELIDTVKRRRSTGVYGNVMLKDERSYCLGDRNNKAHLIRDVFEAHRTERLEKKQRVYGIVKYFWPQVFYHSRILDSGETHLETTNVLIEYSGQSDDLDKAHPEMCQVGKWIIPVIYVNIKLSSYQFQIEKLTKDKLNRYEQAMKDWRKLTSKYTEHTLALEIEGEIFAKGVW